MGPTVDTSRGQNGPCTSRLVPGSSSIRTVPLLLVPRNHEGSLSTKWWVLRWVLEIREEPFTSQPQGPEQSESTRKEKGSSEDVTKVTDKRHRRGEGLVVGEFRPNTEKVDERVDLRVSGPESSVTPYRQLDPTILSFLVTRSLGTSRPTRSHEGRSFFIERPVFEGEPLRAHRRTRRCGPSSTRAQSLSLLQ